MCDNFYSHNDLSSHFLLLLPVSMAELHLNLPFLFTIPTGSIDLNLPRAQFRLSIFIFFWVLELIRFAQPTCQKLLCASHKLICKLLAYLHKCTPRYNYNSVAQYRPEQLNNTNTRIIYFKLTALFSFLWSVLHVFGVRRESLRVIFIWSRNSNTHMCGTFSLIDRLRRNHMASQFLHRQFKNRRKDIDCKGTTCFLLQNHHLVIRWDLLHSFAKTCPSGRAIENSIIAYGATATHGFETISFQLHFMPLLQNPYTVNVITETNKWLPFRKLSFIESLNWRTCNYAESTLTKFGVSVP